MSYVICFIIDKWTEGMLSKTSSQECIIVQLVITIVEFIVDSYLFTVMVWPGLKPLILN